MHEGSAAEGCMQLFSRLPADLWYLILQHVRQADMLALATTGQASAEVFRNPPVCQYDLTICCIGCAVRADGACEVLVLLGRHHLQHTASVRVC
jgi:hypothetical protein